MNKQFLDKDGLQIVAEKVNEAREVGAGAMALAQEVSETSTIAFTGTFAQWNALSAGEKAKFAGHIVNITDDTSDVQNAVRNPDWSRVVDLTTHTFSTDAYIVPEDGIFIVCRLRPVSSDVTSTMFVNGNLFIQSKSPTTGNADVNSNTCIPVAKGDSITIDNPRVQDPVYFVPYKTEIVITEPVNYSTSEQFTGKYWIDGKKIYRRIIHDTLTNPTVLGDRRTFIKEYSFYADNVINVGGYVVITSATDWINGMKLPVAACGLGNTNSDRLVVTLDNLDSSTTTPTQGVTRLLAYWYDPSAFPTSIETYIVIEYTKVTD